MSRRPRPVEGGLEAAYKADLAAAEDPEALRADIVERLNRVRSPFRTAEAYGIEEIIDPRDTRPLLCEFANLAAPPAHAGPGGLSAPALRRGARPSPTPGYFRKNAMTERRQIAGALSHQAF